jgi:hypothetical protein
VIETVTPELNAWLDCFYLMSAAMLAAVSSFSRPNE